MTQIVGGFLVLTSPESLLAGLVESRRGRARGECKLIIFVPITVGIRSVVAAITSTSVATIPTKPVTSVA